MSRLRMAHAPKRRAKPGKTPGETLNLRSRCMTSVRWRVARSEPIPVNEEAGGRRESPDHLPRELEVHEVGVVRDLARGEDQRYLPDPYAGMELPGEEPGHGLEGEERHGGGRYPPLEPIAKIVVDPP